MEIIFQSLDILIAHKTSDTPTKTNTYFLNVDSMSNSNRNYNNKKKL